MVGHETGRRPETAWKWFERTDVEGQAHPRATCNRCGKVFNSAQYGRDLVPHIANKCPDVLPSEKREARDLIAKASIAKRQKQNIVPPLSPRPTPRKTTRSSLTPDRARSSPLLPPLSKEETRVFHLAIAMAFYATCMPFHKIENPSFQKALLFFAPPGTKLPTRKALAGPLLDAVYQEVRDKTVDCLREADKVSLVTDGWTNPNNAGVMNFILTSPSMKQPVFWSSVPTQAASHTADYIASKIEAVISEVEGRFGLGKIVGVISDNAKNMLGTWSKLQVSRKYLLFHGCAAHQANLLLKDLFKKIPLFEKSLKEAVLVAKFALKRQAFLYTFRMAQLDQDCRRSLSLPVETRWYSHAICVRSVIENRSALLALFENDELITIYEKNKGNVEKLAAVRAILADERFWALGAIVIQLVTPITDALTLLETNSTPLSDVYHQFLHLTKHSVYSDGIFGLDADVQPRILDRIHCRMAKAVSDTSKVAYILDPRFPLDDQVRHHLLPEIEIIVDVLLRTDPSAKEANIRADVKKFLEKKLEWKKEQFDGATKYHPKEWWNFSEYDSMRESAKILFSVPASSAASERSWSIHSLIHTERRSRLHVDRVEKLVFIYSNAGPDRNPFLLNADYDVMEQDRLQRPHTSQQ